MHICGTMGRWDRNIQVWWQRKHPEILSHWTPFIWLSISIVIHWNHKANYTVIQNIVFGLTWRYFTSNILWSDTGIYCERTKANTACPWSVIKVSVVLNSKDCSCQQLSAGPGLLLPRNFHEKIHVSCHEFSSLASDWMAAEQPANQKPSKNIFVNWCGSWNRFMWVVLAPVYVQY